MKDNGGFLLLEVIVTIAIITCGLIFVMKTYAVTSQVIKNSKDLFKFGLLLEEAMFTFEEKGVVPEGSWEQDVEGHKEFLLKAKTVPMDSLDLNLVTLDIARRNKPGQDCYLYMYLNRA